MRIRLLCSTLFSMLLAGTAMASSLTPISLPTSWSCPANSVTTCGIAADAVASWPLGAFDPYADPSTYPANYYAAAAMFVVSGNSLDVYLANISQRDTDVPSYVLTGVLFDIGSGSDNHADAPTLTAVSANLAADGTIINPEGCDGGTAQCNPALTDVGAEWAYNKIVSPVYPNNFPGLPAPSYGISSSGLGYYGPENLFPHSGTNLAGPASPDGVQFGITAAGDNPATGNGGIAPSIPGTPGVPATSWTWQCKHGSTRYNVTNSNPTYTCPTGYTTTAVSNNGVPAVPGTPGVPLIKSGSAWGAVVFHFTFTGGPIDVSRINNVLFQYGTSTTEPFTWPNCVVNSTSGAINGPSSNPVECGTPVCTDCGGNEVPEPASLILVSSGFLGLAGFLRRRLT